MPARGTLLERTTPWTSAYFSDCAKLFTQRLWAQWADKVIEDCGGVAADGTTDKGGGRTPPAHGRMHT